MPFQNEHAFRILDPEKFQSESFRRKNIAPGIDIVMGKLQRQDSMIAQSYRFDVGKFTAAEAKKWMQEHKEKYLKFEPAKELISTIPILQNDDLIIPFVRDGTKAYDLEGNEHVLTAEALDSDFKTWEGGRITVNHEMQEKGLIKETWRQKPFVIGRFSGLDPVFRAKILSPEFVGVSQESLPLEISSSGEVKRLKGTGNTFVFDDRIPGCPKSQGCGIIQNSNFSLNTSKINSTTSKIRGTMADYTPEQLKDMLTFMKGHPDMMTDEMKSMMAAMSGGGASVVSAKPDTKKDDEISALRSKLAELEKGAPVQIESAVKAALITRENELAAAKKYDDAAKELMSAMPKKEADDFLSTKPTIDQILSTAKVLKTRGQAGAGSGEQIDSAKKETDYEKLNKQFNKRLGRK